MPHILCANPVVAVFDDVLRPDQCRHVIELGGGATLTRAKVHNNAVTGEFEGRDNRQAPLDQWADPVLTEICTTVSALVRIPPENCEPAKLLHYRGGEKFDTHHDAYAPYLPNQAEEMLAGGQRLFTTLVYLNDVAGGGDTVFPKLQVSVRPVPGRVLLFGNTLPGQTERHPHAVHAGTPVTEGEKWVLSLWWRERIFHRPRSYPAEEGEMRQV